MVSAMKGSMKIVQISRKAYGTECDLTLRTLTPNDFTDLPPGGSSGRYQQLQWRAHPVHYLR